MGIVVLDCADVAKEPIVWPSESDPRESLLQGKVHDCHEHINENHPRAMQQCQALTRVVRHHLPHLTQDSSHIHRRPYAFDHRTLLRSVAQALGLAVWTPQAGADVALVERFHLHRNSLGLVSSSSNPTDPQLGQPCCALVFWCANKCNVRPLCIDKAILGQRLAGTEQPTNSRWRGESFH